MGRETSVTNPRVKMPQAALQCIANHPVLSKDQMAKLEKAKDLPRLLRYNGKLLIHLTERYRGEFNHDDFFSELLFTIVKKAHLYKPKKGSFYVWIFYMAREARKSLRKKSPLIKTPTKEPERERCGGEYIDEEFYTDQVVNGDKLPILILVNQLSNERERQAVFLVCVKGHTLKSAGEVIGCSHETARKAKNLGIDHLQVLAREGGYEMDDFT